MVTIDIAALIYQALSERFENVNQGTLTDTLDPRRLPAIVYEMVGQSSVANAPRPGRGTTADVTLTALAASRVEAHDACDAALAALMAGVGAEPEPGAGWLNRVTLTQEPISVALTQVSGANIYQYSAACRVTARRGK